MTCPTAPDYTFRAYRQNARGLRARGAVALLGGLCAERRPTVATADVVASGTPGQWIAPSRLEVPLNDGCSTLGRRFRPWLPVSGSTSGVFGTR